MGIDRGITTHTAWGFLKPAAEKSVRDHLSCSMTLWVKLNAALPMASVEPPPGFALTDTYGLPVRLSVCRESRFLYLGVNVFGSPLR